MDVYHKSIGGGAADWEWGFVCDTEWIITSCRCRMSLSGEELVIIMPRSGCGVPDVVVPVGHAGDGELVVVGLWY